jgi:hypothetical protein
VSNGRRGYCRKGLELDFINALGMIKKAKSKKVKKNSFVICFDKWDRVIPPVLLSNIPKPCQKALWFVN